MRKTPKSSLPTPAVWPTASTSSLRLWWFGLALLTGQNFTFKVINGLIVPDKQYRLRLSSWLRRQKNEKSIEE